MAIKPETYKKRELRKFEKEKERKKKYYKDKTDKLKASMKELEKAYAQDMEILDRKKAVVDSRVKLMEEKSKK